MLRFWTGFKSKLWPTASCSLSKDLPDAMEKSIERESNPQKRLRLVRPEVVEHRVALINAEAAELAEKIRKQTEVLEAFLGEI